MPFAPDTPAVALRGVAKRYAGAARALHALAGVDFEVARGEFVAVVGPSGSGKSTLLNIVGGIDRADRGEVVVGGAALHRMDEAALTAWRSTGVGIVFQFFQLLPTLTALENAALPMDFARRWRPHDRWARARRHLEQVGLGDKADHLPVELSGGEQQRVAIARAVAKRPDVLLCDEPTGALDYATGKLVLETIARINRELGTTAVVITHNAAIAGMADRVIYLADGRIQRVVANAHKVSPSELAW